MRRAAVALAALALHGCGGDGAPRDDRSPGPGPKTFAGDLELRALGAGAQKVTVIRERDLRPPFRVVVLLHGWGAIEPIEYRAWIEHLAAGGNAVIYPAYQRNVLEPPDEVLTNAMAGIKLALDAIDEDPASVVVAGHSAGGALAADYAASAARAGLPVPRGVLSIYPGRAFDGTKLRIPSADLSQIPASTRLVVLAGANDAIVGSRFARDIYRGATAIPRGRRVYRLIDNTTAEDHLGPIRDDAAARAAFWTRLDELIRLARG